MITLDKDYEVISSNFPYNMAGWCTEKSGNVVKYLKEIVCLIENETKDPDELREEIKYYLGIALWDATKMLSFSCGAEWETSDSDLIMEKGETGYNELMIKYGLK